MDVAPEEAIGGDAWHRNELAIRESFSELGEKLVMGHGIGGQQWHASQDADRPRSALCENMPRNVESETRSGGAQRNDAADRPGSITNRGEVEIGTDGGAAEMIEEFGALSQQLGVGTLGNQACPGESNLR